MDNPTSDAPKAKAKRQRTRQNNHWNGEPPARLLLKMPAPLAAELRAFAQANGVSMTLVVVSALKQYLDTGE